LSVVVSLLILFSSKSFAANPSKLFCAYEASRIDGTTEVIGYLTQLVDNGIIGDPELGRLIGNLKNGILVNPILEDDIGFSSPHLLQREGLENLIQTVRVDQQKLLDWAEENLREKNRVALGRQKTSEQTHVSRKIEFHKIHANKVTLNDWIFSINLEIEKPFEMMSTPVTQMQWATIMGKSSSSYADGNSSVITINGAPITIGPDNPVVDVSWIDVNKFIAKLNQLSFEDDPLLYKIIEGHRKGDQFRLPTSDEANYVARVGISLADIRRSWDSLAARGWRSSNEVAFWPVGSFRPLIVDQHEFYDMLGGLPEWAGNSGFAGNQILYGLGGSDPTITEVSKDDHPRNIGFRLVRERP